MAISDLNNGTRGVADVVQHHFACWAEKIGDAVNNWFVVRKNPSSFSQSRLFFDHRAFLYNFDQAKYRSVKREARETSRTSRGPRGGGLACTKRDTAVAVTLCFS